MYIVNRQENIIINPDNFTLYIEHDDIEHSCIVARSNITQCFKVSLYNDTIEHVKSRFRDLIKALHIYDVYYIDTSEGYFKYK